MDQRFEERHFIEVAGWERTLRSYLSYCTLSFNYLTINSADLYILSRLTLKLKQSFTIHYLISHAHYSLLLSFSVSGKSPDDQALHLDRFNACKSPDFEYFTLLSKARSFRHEERIITLSFVSEKSVDRQGRTCVGKRATFLEDLTSRTVRSR